MKKFTTLLFVIAVLFTTSTQALNVFYLRSNIGEPWGVSTNVNEMNAVFGSGNWTLNTYESLSVPAVFNSNTKLIFMEGSDNNANALNTFLIANLPAIEAWVNAGGVLFLNAAPNQGGNINFGFGGVLLTFSANTGTGTITSGQSSHPIFVGPNACGSSWSGNYFGHANVSGGGITSLISGNGIVMAEKIWGAGRIIFGGMTMSYFHSPQPQGSNLRMNILSYLNNSYNPYLTSLCTGTNVYCNSNDDGTASANALSGTAPYTYLWSNTSTAATATGLAAGSYTVTVTDAASATISCIVSITNATLQITPPVATYCNNPVTLTSSLANTYLWSTGATSRSIVVNSIGNYTVTVNNCTSATATVSTLIAGNPAVFGSNEWVVYAWNSGDGANPATAWINNYSGYYTDNSLNFNTDTYWGSGASPSNASGYNGCPVGVDNHSWSAKRQGFPCGYFTINITGHDDMAELYVNGTMVWQHLGCCDAHTNVWSGFLNSTSQIEFRASDGGGGSVGSISIVPVPFNITASGTILCNNNTVTLSVPVLLGNYLWSPGGETTTSITTQTSGIYTVSVSDGNGCTISTSITLTDVVPPTVVASSSVTICNGSSTILSASGALNYSWSPTSIALDGIPTAQLAVGLHKLRSAYAGNALQLRRSSDNTTMDFGFVGNNLDVSAIAIWLAGDDGFCSILYDQSGNANNVVQANNANQPKYIASGINGKPILNFNTSQFMQRNTNFQPPYSVVYAARQTGPARARVLSSINNNWLLGWWNGSKNQAFFEGWITPNPGTTPADNASYIYSATGNGSSSTYYENGILQYNNNGGVQGPNGIQLNGLQGLSEMSDCDFMDVMVFGSELSNVNRATVEGSVGGYYNISTASNSNQITVTPSTTTIYTVTGSDVNGCTGTATVQVFVNQPPVLTCPVDVSTTLASGVCSATVTYPPATATGNNPIVITYSQTSGTSFPSGTTVVTVTATDANGCTSTCSFNVIVLDVTPPVISCPNSVTVNNDPGVCGAVVNITATVTDDCPTVSSATATYNYTGAIQTFVVPAGCTSINITGVGAAGGNYNNNSNLGGKGASMAGDFASTPGETLYILVGQQGGSSNSYYNGGGGGGGTFISRDPAMITNLLLAAGGGGGGGNYGTSDANTTTNGNNGANGNYYGTAFGGINGNGGQGWNGGGGAGWNNDGGEYECGNRGHAPLNGGAGGNGCGSANGGYGGGGGNNSGAGGGGGYSGGGSGDYDYDYGSGIGAGGGGSFNSGTNQINSTGVGSGNGQVVINYTLQYPIVTVTTGVQSGSVFPVGTTTNIWTATDAAGNTATCSATITVVDIEAPVVYCPANVTVNNDLGQCSAVVNYSIPVVGDNCCPLPTSLVGYSFLGFYGGHSYFLSNSNLDWTDARNAAISAGGKLVSVNSAGENNFLAANNFNVWIGASDEITDGVWIWESGEPFIYNNWNAGEPNNAGGNQDYIQFYTNGTWDDLGSASLPYVVEFSCGLTPTLVSGPASGGVFSLGTTTVTYLATDGTGLTSTCSFTITVVDNEAPVITSCGPTQTVATDGNCQAAVPDFTSGVVVTDNCTATNALIITQSPLAGVIKDRGSYTVTLTVTDAVGNSSTCNTTFNVVDNVAPVINCTSGVTVNNAPGTCSAVVTFNAPTVSDNCPITVAGSASFNYTGAVQTWTVPAGVTSIEIEARGAQGGGSSFGSAGGLGAKIIADYAVTPGQVLNIVVGQQGLLQVGGNAQNSSGGGGGSFVYNNGPVLMVAAGGGGGKCNYSSSGPLHAEAAGQIGTTGGASSDGNVGGNSGNGGNAGLWSGVPCAGGGAGWLTNGGGPYGGLGFNSWIGGSGFCGGGGGGCGGVGGFGGGGGGGNHYGGGGGGGGYSGGGGGTDPTHGGGGGSFSSGTNQIKIAGDNLGNGLVVISYQGLGSNIASQTAGLPSGSTFPIGNSVITWTATDGSGNTSTCTQIITVADTRPPVVITPSGNTNFCPGGSVTLTAEAGMSPYLWSTGSTDQAITVSATGNYVVTATEQNGCTKSGSQQVTVAPIGKTAVVTNVTCKGGSNGSITVTGTGGIGAPYSYLWANGNSTDTRNNLTSGSYSVTITDGTGCSALFYISVNQPAQGIVVNLSKTNVRCSGGNSGNITASPTGGTAPYSYSWSNGSTTATISGLTIGTYTVTVSDVNGCVSTKSTTLTTNPALIVTISFGPAPGTANASVSGGIPGYTYLWNTVPNQTLATATGLIAGHTYKVKVTDTKNCTKLITVIMPNLRLNATEDFEVKLYPNPSDGLVTLHFNGNESYKFNLNVFDLTARLVYSIEEVKLSGSFSRVYDFSSLSKGVYNIQVQTDKGNKLFKLILE